MRISDWSSDVCSSDLASNPYYGPMAGIADEQFRKIFDNNVLANHWLITMVAPEMIERREGAIIVVSSIGGLIGSDVIGAYNVSTPADRTEESRVGKSCVSTCRSRLSPYP